jgi:hypothetical protein
MNRLINSLQINSLYFIIFNTRNLNLSYGNNNFILTAIEFYTNKIIKEKKVMNFIK